MEFKKLDKSDISFPTNDNYPRELIERIQTELLAMVKVVSKILETNQIPYSIAYGTLFGALKFEGFLPWDDDVDFFLFDESYDKAIQCLSNELPNHLLIHGSQNDPSYFLAWNSVKNLNIKVTDNGIYNPHNKLLKYRNLGLDLYRLKKIKEDELDNFKEQEAIKFFERKLKGGIINKKEFESSVEGISLMYNGKEKKMQSYSNKDIYAFVVKQKKPIFAEDIFPLKKYKFEDIELLGPNHPKEVLECSFNDIDKLPDFHERKPHLKEVQFIK